MRAIDFDKIDPFYKIVNDEIPFGFFHFQLTRWLIPNYHILKNTIYSMENLDVSIYENTYRLKNLLQNDYVFFAQEEHSIYGSTFQKYLEKFEDVREKIFNHLDGIENPYKELLHPKFEYGYWFDLRSDKNPEGYGYVQDIFTGSVNTNIAFDYLQYKLEK